MCLIEDTLKTLQKNTKKEILKICFNKKSDREDQNKGFFDQSTFGLFHVWQCCVQDLRTGRLGGVGGGGGGPARGHFETRKLTIFGCEVGQTLKKLGSRKKYEELVIRKFE